MKAKLELSCYGQTVIDLPDDEWEYDTQEELLDMTREYVEENIFDFVQYRVSLVKEATE